MKCLARAFGLSGSALLFSVVFLLCVARTAPCKSSPAKSAPGKSVPAKPAPVKPAPVEPVRWLTGPPRDSLLRPGADSVKSGLESDFVPATLRIRRVKQDSALTTLYCSVLDPQGEPVFGVQPADLRCLLNERPLDFTGFDILALSADEHLVTVLSLGFKDTAVSAPRMVSALSGSFVPELEEGKPDLCALLTFSGKVAVPRLFTSDPLLLQQALSSIHFGGEGLVVNAAVDAARTLIRQHDTSGFGAVVVVGDAGPSDSGSQDEASLATAPGDIPIYGVNVSTKGSKLPDRLAALCAAGRGEFFVTTTDSAAMHTAVSRVIHILQRQLVIKLPGRISGRLKLAYSGADGSLSLADSITLAALWPETTGEPEPDPRSRLVVISLAVGAILLVLILIQNARTRTR